MKDPKDWTPREAAFFEEARLAGSMMDSAYRSFSGTDVAEAEVWGCVRRFYIAVAQGGDVEAAIAAEDVRWRSYATEQEKKVNAAPKTKRGPMSGHSVISHRWVSPDLFQSKGPHLRQMVKIIEARIASGK